MPHRTWMIAQVEQDGGRGHRRLAGSATTMSEQVQLQAWRGACSAEAVRQPEHRQGENTYPSLALLCPPPPSCHVCPRVCRGVRSRTRSWGCEGWKLLPNPTHVEWPACCGRETRLRATMEIVQLMLSRSGPGGQMSRPSSPVTPPPTFVRAGLVKIFHNIHRHHGTPPEIVASTEAKKGRRRFPSSPRPATLG